MTGVLLLMRASIAVAIGFGVTVAGAQAQFKPNQPRIAAPPPPPGGTVIGPPPLLGGTMTGPTIQVMPRASAVEPPNGAAHNMQTTSHRWPRRRPECWQEYYTGIVHCRTPARAANPNRDSLPRPAIPPKQGLQVRVPIEY